LGQWLQHSSWARSSGETVNSCIGLPRTLFEAAIFRAYSIDFRDTTLERIPAARPDNRAIYHREWKDSWAHEVNEEYRSIGIVFVPDFVLVAVVENHALSFLPTTNVVSDSNSATAFLPGNYQSKVITQHALIGSSVRRYVLSG
jgi:hypothetical protein